MDQPASRTTRSARSLCLAGPGLGAIGLVGWLAGADAPVTLVPGQPPMMPNTALALILLGFAGAMRLSANAGRAARSLSALLAGVALAVGLVTILEYVLDLPFSIDQLVIRTEAGPFPGRQSPPVAIATALLAAAILAFEWRSAGRVRPREWLALCAAFIAFTFMAAQLFGAMPLYQFSDMAFVGVAVPTALGLLLISAGLLLGQPDSGLTRIATSSSPGDTMLRRLAPAFILIALSIGLVASLLSEIVASEHVAFVRAGLTIFGIAVVLPLFVITAKRLNRAHEALERSQTQYRELVQLASDGIFVADLDGRFTEVNEAGCRMLGYSREEILGKTIMDLILPEERERLFSHRERFLKGGTDVGEWMLLKKDGTYLPVEVSAKILPDGRWQAIDRDISERKRAEVQLRQAQERVELALRGGNLGSWDWNIVTGEVIFSPRCAEMRGFRPEELTPRADAYFAAIHPDDSPAFQRALNDCIEGRRPEFECEYRARTKSGDWVWTLSQGNIFGRDEQGRPTRMVGTALDVTPRKHAEREQRLLAELGSVLGRTLDFEERLTNIAQLLVRDLADICIIDTAEDDGARRTRTACRDPAQKWVCDGLARALADDEQLRAASLLFETRKAMLIQKVTADVIDHWSRDAEQRTALRGAGVRSAMAIPLHARGRAMGTLVLFSASRSYEPVDLRIAETVAERAATSLDNARLFATATRATRARDDMLGFVAHDLRNPLAAIVALAAVLQNGPERDVGEEIEQAANRMSRLIRDIIDVTRIDAGQLPLERARVAPAEVVSSALKAQMQLAKAASLKLGLDLPADMPDIWADRDRLLRVLENLIGNAIKFTKPGGHITLGATAQSAEVLFSVADSGGGIESTHLPHVFDRFWQAPGAKRRGAGLGLPIVKGIVEAHGGQVWAESLPGKGSTFFFTVPRAAQTVPRTGEVALHALP